MLTAKKIDQMAESELDDHKEKLEKEINQECKKSIDIGIDPIDVELDNSIWRNTSDLSFSSLIFKKRTVAYKQEMLKAIKEKLEKAH